MITYTFNLFCGITDIFITCFLTVFFVLGKLHGQDYFLERKLNDMFIIKCKFVDKQYSRY